MIPHLDIDAEYSYTRISCLIEEEKNNFTGKHRVLMPAILFYKDKQEFDKGIREYTSIDNPSYIFSEFVEFLERFLLDKLTHKDRKENWNVLDVITTYEQARELLNMIKWLDDYGVDDKDDF